MSVRMGIACWPFPSRPGAPNDRRDQHVPNNASAKKRLRQSQAQRLQNRTVRSEIRTRTKKILSMESAEEANAALPELYAVLDRAAQRRIIQPNAAARQKARVARHVVSLTQA